VGGDGVEFFVQKFFTDCRPAHFPRKADVEILFIKEPELFRGDESRAIHGRDKSNIEAVA
jgi:hypothetical protein